MALSAVLPGVVADFVIVPDPDHRVLPVKFLQILIEPVLCVSSAVVRETHDFMRRIVGANAVLIAILVNVIAQMYHGLKVIAFGHAPIGVKVPCHIVGAGHEREPHPGDVRVRIRQGARTTDRRRLARRQESIVVDLIGLQSRDLDLDGVAGIRLGQRAAAAYDVREARVHRQFVANARRRAAWRLGPGPQDHRIRPGITAGDAVRETGDIQWSVVITRVGRIRAGIEQRDRTRSGGEHELASGEWRHGKQTRNRIAELSRGSMKL